MFKINQFAKMIGVTSQTLRNWANSDDESLLKPFKVINKYRYYSYQQYVNFVGEENVEYNREGRRIEM